MASAMTDMEDIVGESSDEMESRTQDEPKSERPLNKENVSIQTRTPCEPPVGSPQPRGLSNRTDFQLPHQPLAEHVSEEGKEGSPFQSPRQKTELPYLRTPAGTSKLLREHMKQVGLTPKRPNLESGAVRVDTAHTPKRLLSSGPVRVDTATRPSPKSIKKPQPRRVGYDGTLNTPSRELLKSTASSRSHQIHKPIVEQPHQDSAPPSPEIPLTPPPVSTVEEVGSSEESVLDGSLDSSLVRSPVPQDGATITSTATRQGCENPVALTLLNDGREDLQRLLERDVSSPVPMATEELDHNGDDSTVASCPSILKVSSSLLDVMDQSDVASLARPVPFRACRSHP